MYLLGYKNNKETVFQYKLDNDDRVSHISYLNINFSKEEQNFIDDLMKSEDFDNFLIAKAIIDNKNENG